MRLASLCEVTAEIRTKLRKQVTGQFFIAIRKPLIQIRSLSTKRRRVRGWVGHVSKKPTHFEMPWGAVACCIPAKRRAFEGCVGPLQCAGLQRVAGVDRSFHRCKLNGRSTAESVCKRRAWPGCPVEWPRPAVAGRLGAGDWRFGIAWVRIPTGSRQPEKSGQPSCLAVPLQLACP